MSMPDPHRVIALVAATFLSLGLAACASINPVASNLAGSPSVVPTSSDPGAAGCALTPDAPPAATLEMAGRAFGAAPTVHLGQAVAFVNRDDTAHSITEGHGGHADDNACVRKRLGAHESIVVTFVLPGDYPITCTIHASMQTVVHVRP